MTSPDETVAEAVLAAFKEKDLVAAELLVGLAESLVAGSLTAGDWRRIAEGGDEKGGEAHDAKED